MGRSSWAAEDPDVADEMQRILGDEGIEVVTGGRDPAGARPVRRGRRVIVRTRLRRAKRSRAATSWSRRAACRTPPGSASTRPASSWTRRGYIRVNERLETSAPDVWAIGECAGSPQFTHVSDDDFRIIRDNLAGGQRSTRDRLVPYCMFTDPPLARVGLSETRGAAPGRRGARREAADERRAADADDRGNTRLHEGSCRRERRSHSRLHHDRRRGGRGHGRGADGDAGGVALSRLRDAILAHPTMAEGLGFLFSNVPPVSTPRVTPDSASLTPAGPLALGA